MAPRAKTQKRLAAPSPDPEGIFRGMVVFLVSNSVQPLRLKIWKQKLLQMGAVVEDELSKRVTHVFAANLNALLQKVNQELLKQFEGVKFRAWFKKLLLYDWLGNCLQSGEKVSEDPYTINIEPEGANKSSENMNKLCHKPNETSSSGGEPSYCKRARTCEDSEAVGEQGKSEKQANQASPTDVESRRQNTKAPSSNVSISTAADSSIDVSNEPNKEVGDSLVSSLYRPPDLNRNITEIFGKLINIYRALGDERRSFSYYKAIPVIEKLPYKIQSVDQVKHLPAIGKSMQDHINEIVTTGKLSKLEHFEKDEKVRTVSLFGEVWGIGPATALKLYKKGYRTLDDLKNDESLTNSQKIGLQFFDDIKKRIPRHEVRDMEMLLQKAGEEVLPGVVVVCGGSYRRGKASCGDLDIIITHPDGKSHKGFLPRYVQHLKDMNFLREDLVFSTHSTEGTDSGVDTYFGLCTYPGREQRHRIDLKVYPRSIYAFGLIAWTGNDVLNRRLRLLAESKGYCLDDTGLFLATQGSSGKRGARSSTSVSSKTEKEVFDVLGFHWLEPHERNL